jgi:hypothetical protein
MRIAMGARRLVMQFASPPALRLRKNPGRDPGADKKHRHAPARLS